MMAKVGRNPETNIMSNIIDKLTLTELQRKFENEFKVQGINVEN
jgi:hypothetical protein